MSEKSLSNDRLQSIRVDEDKVPLADSRLDFENGNYAVREGGFIKLYLKDDRELFSVDANTLPFERKLINAVMQVYLLGFNHGRSQEKATLKNKLAVIINLVFE